MHDARDAAAGESQLVAFLSHANAADLQQSRRKDRRDAYFPSRRHMQAPDFHDRQEQYCEVRHHVDCTSRDKDLLVVDAVTRLRGVPQLASRDAWPDFDRQVGEIEEEVEEYHALYYPICSSLAAGDEDA